MPLSEVFPCQALTLCCCNLLFTISSKGRHEGCDWASAMLRLFQAAGTAPFGAKSKWAQTNHQHRESEGAKHCFSSPGAKTSIYWCSVFYVQITNQNQLFPKVLCNLLFCKISFTLHFWSAQFHMRATQLRWSIKKPGVEGQESAHLTASFVTQIQCWMHKSHLGSMSTGNSRLWCSSQGRVTREMSCAQFLKLTEKQLSAGRNSWTVIGCFGLAGFVQDGCYIFEQLSTRFDGIFTDDKLNLLTTT